MSALEMPLSARLHFYYHAAVKNLMRRKRQANYHASEAARNRANAGSVLTSEIRHIYFA